MNIAVICSTPYQTMDAINLITNDLSYKNNKIDLYYRNFNQYSNEALHNIANLRLFDNIYEYDIVQKKEIFKYIYNVACQILDSKKFIKLLVKQKLELDIKKYDIITVTSGTEFEIAMTRVFPCANTIAYDDGLGSYVGDIVHNQTLNWFWKRFRDTSKIKPICLYVNNVDFCESTISDNHKPLRKIQDNLETLKYIDYIFNYKFQNIYRKKKYIYLTQPMKEIAFDYNKVQDDILNTIAVYKNNLIIRYHPRDIRSDYGNIEADNINTLWELICNNEINDNHVLISVCSTAQIMPKLMFNKEPYLIFTYKMYPEYKNQLIVGSFNKTIENLRKVYKNKDKIIIPNNIIEFEQVLDLLSK